MLHFKIFVRLLSGLIMGGALLLVTSCAGRVSPDEVRPDHPSIFPDYVGVTIPVGIAPLNFRMDSLTSGVEVEVVSSGGETLLVKGTDHIVFPETDWRDMVEQSTGDSLMLTVTALKDGRWVQYAPFAVHVSAHPIDATLVYRLIAPGYEVYSQMGIYQRQLASFKQTALVENTLVPGSCVNCHSFRQTAPGQMSLHMRGEIGGTIVKNGVEMQFLNTKTEQTLGNCVYPYWHPGGDYIAYSVNKTQQAFHIQQTKRVEVFDHASDVVVYHLPSNQLVSCDALRNDSVFETFPAFSPDGKWLYYCTAAVQPIPEGLKEIRYNLCRIAFDVQSGTFGQAADTLVDAVAKGKSVSFPRPSYDGRYLMYTLSDYGNFSIWHREADLWMLDLQTGQSRALTELNSDEVESYHSWSSNSRWVVFSSRRIDGLYTRLYLSCMDESGQFSKPFLLPQRHPGQNDALLFSYNVPEFVNGAVQMSPSEVEHLVKGAKTNVGYRNETSGVDLNIESE